MILLFNNKISKILTSESANSIRKSIQFAQRLFHQVIPNQEPPCSLSDRWRGGTSSQATEGRLAPPPIAPTNRGVWMRLDIQPPGFRLPPAFPFQFRQTTWTNVHHQWSTVLFHLSSQVQHFPNIFPFHLKLTTISIIQYQWSLLFFFSYKNHL